MVEEERDDLGRDARLGRAAARRAREDVVDLELLGLGEDGQELGGLVGEPQEALAVLEVHREDPAPADLVVRERERVAPAPEQPFHPRRRHGLEQARELHAQAHEPRAVDHPRVPRDADVGDPRRDAERPALLHGREAPLADVARERRVGRAPARLAVHLAGPEQVEVLLEHGAAPRRGHDEAPQHVDGHRAEPGRDARADEERAERELRVWPRPEEDLGPGGAGRGEQQEPGEGPGRSASSARQARGLLDFSRDLAYVVTRFPWVTSRWPAPIFSHSHERGARRL